MMQNAKTIALNREVDTQQYVNDFSEVRFWKKLKEHASEIGAKGSVHATRMFYTLVDKATPSHPKVIILGTLGYWIFPVDLVPDFILGVGYSDDLSVISLAYYKVREFIKPTHKTKAKAKLATLFRKKTASLV
ncbi:DUF1232 domain-containing protein [Akkermansiaceae bacterium]|nr:DUF1232 domain-containing protein [Akkermansiaceae bacterium]